MLSIRNSNAFPEWQHDLNRMILSLIMSELQTLLLAVVIVMHTFLNYKVLPDA